MGSSPGCSPGLAARALKLYQTERQGIAPIRLLDQQLGWHKELLTALGLHDHLRSVVGSGTPGTTVLIAHLYLSPYLSLLYAYTSFPPCS